LDLYFKGYDTDIQRSIASAAMLRIDAVQEMKKNKCSALSNGSDIFPIPSSPWKAAERGRTVAPCTKSAAAMLRIRRLNGVLRFLLGSLYIVKQIRKLQGEATRDNAREINADETDSSLGAVELAHTRTSRPKLILLQIKTVLSFRAYQ
jgi:hypothetical protein